ncbi:hypothetical protein AT15_10150 [Kosmotoga arenicorallina S304]|uniref:HD-GYP domain-containing protein n=1 Tax=Kosmotoga arenicorallina S304 TaxID=1453497 RepID=A0A176K173_9BACT|nr:HD domain-containing phosphohydrolase [Kosmotoga arenicorallina]OAA30636.1 hypothetical protein AT15_10150 [Kosmotoga arenicorallina S304]
MKRSVKMNIKIVFYFIIISIVSVVVLILFVDFLGMKLRSDEKLLEKIVQNNSVLEKVEMLHSLYHDYGEKAFETREYIAISHNLEKELKTTEKSLADFSIPFPSETILSFVKANSEYSKVPPELYKIENRVQEWISSKEQFLSKLSSVSLKIVLVVFVSIGIGVLIIGKDFMRFTNYIIKNTEVLDSSINGFAVELSLPPPISEAQAVFAVLRETIKEIQFNQEVLSLEEAGTLEDIMPKIFETLNKHMNVDRAAFAFLDSFKNVIAETAVSKARETHLKEGFTTNIEKTSLQKLLDSKQNRIINDLEYYYNNVHKSKPTELLLKEGMKSSITVPVFMKGSCIGFFFVNSMKKDAFSEKEALQVTRFANLIKGISFSSYINQELIAKATRAFADLVEKKDNETGKHLTRVSLYSHLIASKLASKNRNISPKFVREMLWFSPAHDIGKVGIPDHILLKPGRLTADEFEIMKTHVTIGEKIIDNMNESLKGNIGIDFLKTAKEIIMGHHEKWDGSGYPRGLKGEEIPLAGRITAVVDVFDALTSKRSYKPAYSLEKSLKIMHSGRGSHFDPLVFDAFMESFDEVKIIYEKLRDTGKEPKAFEGIKIFNGAS